MNSATEAASKKRPDDAEWNRIAESAKFQHLLAVKKIFIIPAFVFFLGYYLLLPVLAGYAPHLMSLKVFGAVTFAYLFALSQFLVGWIIACLYLQAAARFDKLADDVLNSSSLDRRLPNNVEPDSGNRLPGDE